MILAPQSRIAEYRARSWWGEKTIDDHFRLTLEAAPEREAVIDPPNRESVTDGAPRRLNYRALDELASRMASVFLEHGLRKDDIIAVQLPNIHELSAVYLAAMRIGAIVSPVPVQYREHELLHCLTKARAKAAVTATRIGKWAHAAMFVEMRASLPELRSIFVLGGTPPRGSLGLEALITRADCSVLHDYRRSVEITADDIVTICWTSGTEAMPKGVPRSHNEWLVIAPSIAEVSRLERGCRLLNPSPMVNMSGLSINLATWATLGGTVVHHHPLDLPTMLEQLRTELVGYVVAPPAVLNMLLQKPELLAGIDFGRLRTIGSGGAPLSPWMVRGFQERFGVDIVNHFGSNEGAALSASSQEIADPNLRASHFPRLGVDGVPTRLVASARLRTRLVDLDTGGEIADRGRPGELRFHGPTVFAGYWEAPELTEKAFDEKGFYRTGDLFEIAGDDNQFYRFVGRAKDVIIRGGMNISAEEIENLVLEHPSVREAAAVAVPDEIMGERVCIVIAPREGQTVALDDITDFLRARKIAVFKLPERIHIVDALPRSAVGKILKRVLREEIRGGARELRQ